MAKTRPKRLKRGAAKKAKKNHPHNISNNNNNNNNSTSSGLLPDNVLCEIFRFADLPEFATISLVCEQWKRSLQVVQEDVFHSVVKESHPRLEELMKLIPNGEQPSWKLLLQRRLSSSYTPFALNQELQKDFYTMFCHEGIAAFSNCCHYVCSGAYHQSPDVLFQPRDRGIYFIRLHLNGMNYYESPRFVAASYGDFDYLMEHWESECELLKRWCGVLGLTKEDEYEIEKPESEDMCVMIKFQEPLSLEEPYPFQDEDDYDY